MVDHRLHPDSARWTDGAEAHARRVGAESVRLSWQGDKPTTGLPEAARSARHRLIANAARARGVRVVLFGHTADDAAENLWMRAEGVPLGRLQPWSPSPVWPEGRGVFVLRPLLHAARAELRTLLRDRGVEWLDDPANTDLRFARVRARRALDGGPAHIAAGPACSTDAPQWTERWSAVRLPRDAAIDEARLSALLVCVAGGERPPRSAALARLLARWRDGGDFTATLSGARVEAAGDEVQVTREPGRRGLQSLPLAAGGEAVWDGRFLVRTQASGASVRPLAGLAARLSRDDARRLREAPASARATLPAFVDADGRVTCPLLDPQEGPHQAISLVGARLHAAWGGVRRESDITAPSLLAR